MRRLELDARLGLSLRTFGYISSTYKIGRLGSMALELSSDAQRWLARLPEFVNILLVAFVGLALAQLFWLIWPQPAAEVIAPSQNEPARRADPGEQVDVAAIAGAHLFGQQTVVDAERERQKELNAPETQLNLELTGIIADRDGQRSRALIKTPKGDQEGFKVDEQIVSGVKLKTIYADRVILDRSGRLETLTLESVKNAQAMTGLTRAAGRESAARGTASAANRRATTNAARTAQAANGGDQASQSVSADLGAKLSEVREEIMANPANAQRYIRLRPARQDGSLVGYRIFPGQDDTLFKQAGLQSGELVTAINGQPLNNPAASLKMLGNLAKAGSATITVENDGASRTVEVNFQ